MRRQGHKQKPEKKNVTCVSCTLGVCENCVDRLLVLCGRNGVCECSRPLHAEKRDGEPRLKQVLDPETGSVHTPHLEVTLDGEVIRHYEDQQ